MFKKETVFITGAGASWHYGYPTGEDLVRKVIERAEQLAAFFDEANGSVFPVLPRFVADVPLRTGNGAAWYEAASEARALAGRLRQVNPTLIDYFLAQNADLQEIGRLVIALVIFECEREFERLGGNPNHTNAMNRKAGQGLASSTRLSLSTFDDDWLRFVLYKLTYGCEDPTQLSANKVTFVTFNYDTSLEYRLYHGLNHISHFKEGEIEQFMGGGRFLHVYGAVRERVDKKWCTRDTSLSAHRPGQYKQSVDVLDAVYEASLGIRTIDGPDKLKNAEVVNAAKSKIAKADVVYILGFGFDPQNVERLGLNCLAPGGALQRRVFLTNYGAHNRVSRAASRCFGLSPTAFSPSSWSIDEDRIVNNRVVHYQYEMSGKNVYDAFSQDFDSMESL